MTKIVLWIKNNKNFQKVFSSIRRIVKYLILHCHKSADTNIVHVPQENTSIINEENNTSNTKEKISTKTNSPRKTDEENFTSGTKKRKQTKVNSSKDSAEENKTKKTQEIHHLNLDETIPILEKSIPNPAQTSDLRIMYKSKKNELNSCFPIIYTPQSEALLKLPRKGRSDTKGYKENDFIKAIQQSSLNISISDNCHLTIPRNTNVYEPDIVLFDESINLYIDVEIDEPYASVLRIPTHTIESNDDCRNIFFQESGWVVVRFTEKQVHETCEMCLETLKDIIYRVRSGVTFENYIPKLSEARWDEKQSQKWEKEKYREKYLGVTSFAPQKRTIKIINHSKDEEIDFKIIRTFKYKKEDFSVIPNKHNGKNPFFVRKNKKDFSDSLANTKQSLLGFNEKKHVYTDDLTGNSDRISVTTLIEKFFPQFDKEVYIERRMSETGLSRDEIERELLEPSNRGTEMHENIEHFLKGEKYDSETKEFQLFLNFYENEVSRRGLVFDSAEYTIGLKNSNIAGTVDALFRKSNGDFVMIDWKRSTHLIINDKPKKYGYGRGLSVISHLDNCSYYKYELQQSFYKYILEKDYGITVSSMILVVLHPEYDRYYAIKLDNYRKDEVINMIEEYDKLVK